jgi:hypothetical protein
MTHYWLHPAKGTGDDSETVTLPMELVYDTKTQGHVVQIHGCPSFVNVNEQPAI